MDLLNSKLHCTMALNVWISIFLFYVLALSEFYAISSHSTHVYTYDFTKNFNLPTCFCLPLLYPVIIRDLFLNSSELKGSTNKQTPSNRLLSNTETIAPQLFHLFHKFFMCLTKSTVSLSPVVWWKCLNSVRNVNQSNTYLGYIIA